MSSTKKKARATAGDWRKREKEMVKAMELADALNSIQDEEDGEYFATPSEDESEEGEEDAVSRLERMAGEAGAVSEWSVSGDYWSPSTRSNKRALLSPGVYSFQANMMGWGLDRTSNEFEFPFKVYNAHQHIIDRITQFWTCHGGNLGVLMNGLRGAGKTMTAQLLANNLIREKNMPVLVVRDPVPLQLILNAVKQNLVVIFDEFEKTHNDPAHQQRLLSTIDGMSRSSYNRLFIFTTNSASIDENFKDRPSRIHYKFEFRRVADEVIEGLIADLLPPELVHIKPDILTFLSTREICTIDIVKAVIAEVVASGESPLEFEELLNIAKGKPPAFSISVLHPETGDKLKTISEYFRLEGHQARSFTPLLMGNKHAISEMQKAGNTYEMQSKSWSGRICLNLLEKCEEDNVWLAEIGVPFTKTPWFSYECLRDDYLDDDYTTYWLDEKPEGFKLPSPKKVDKNENQEKKLRSAFQSALAYSTVHGNEKRAVLKVLIEANHETYMVRRYEPTGGAVRFYDGDDD